MPTNGTIIGSPRFAAGHFGNAASGLTDANYVQLAAGFLATGPTLTIEAWLQFSGNGTYVAIGHGTANSKIAAAWVGAVNGQAAFQVVSNGISIYQESGDILAAGPAINDGNWHHVAVVLTPAVARLYVDGLCVGSYGAVFRGIPPTVGGIGAYTYSYNFAWPGSIDEVATWASERYTYNFAVPTAPYTGNEAGLVALYHLDADGTDSNTGAGSAISSPSPLATNVIDPSNAAILYSPYNWSITSGYARTINSGAYLRTIFSGTSVALQFDTSVNAEPYSQLWARIDGQGWQLVQLGSGNPTIPVAYGLTSHAHLLEVVVKSTSEFLTRWTNSQTIVQLTGIVVDAGTSLRKPLRRSRSIVVFGDSITEGYKTVANSTYPLGSDVLGDYAFALTTACDAEVGIIGFGGQGMNGGGQGGVPSLPNSYTSIYAGVARSFSPVPDVAIYNQGTNDGGNIQGAYTTLLQGMIAACPATKHLVLQPFNGAHVSDIQAAISAVNSPSVTYVNTAGWWSAADSSDQTHPWAFFHLSLIAPNLFPIVQAALYTTTSGSTGGSGYTYVSGNVRDASGAPVNGTISFQPIAVGGKQSSFVTGGWQPSRITASPVVANIQGGTFGIYLGDLSLAKPVGMTYYVTVADALSGSILACFGNFAPSGNTYDISTIVNMVTAPATVTQLPTTTAPLVDTQTGLAYVLEIVNGNLVAVPAH